MSKKILPSEAVRQVTSRRIATVKPRSKRVKTRMVGGSLIQRLDWFV